MQSEIPLTNGLRLAARCGRGETAYRDTLCDLSVSVFKSGENTETRRPQRFAVVSEAMSVPFRLNIALFMAVSSSRRSSAMAVPPCWKAIQPSYCERVEEFR